MGPGDRLIDGGTTFNDKGKVYGHTYLNYGKVMAIAFPDGVSLNTEDDFNRFGAYSMIMHKVLRQGRNLLTSDDRDHAKDLKVYAAMLESIIAGDHIPTPLSGSDIAAGAITLAHTQMICGEASVTAPGRLCQYAPGHVGRHSWETSPG